MKSLLITVISTLALGATATANNKVVHHDYTAVLGIGVEGIALNNACITESTVQSITPVEVCTNLVSIEYPAQGESGGYTEWVCQSKEFRTLVASRAFERQVCKKWVRGSDMDNDVCVEFGAKADFMPATIKITTVTLNGGESGTNGNGVEFTFTFPACD